MIISLIHHEIPTTLVAIYHEKPMNKRGLYHRNRRYDVISIERQPFYRDFLPNDCMSIQQIHHFLSVTTIGLNFIFNYSQSIMEKLNNLCYIENVKEYKIKAVQMTQLLFT